LNFENPNPAERRGFNIDIQDEQDVEDPILTLFSIHVQILGRFLHP